MGIMSTARFLSNGANLALMAKLVPEVSRLIKKQGKEEIAVALKTDEGMESFARKIYPELGAEIRNQVPLDGFISFVLKNRAKIMGKKRNQKKVEAMAD